MRLARIELQKSPLEANRTRLAGEIVYDTSSRKSEWIWFDVPDAHAPELNRTGSPWLACLLPLAVTLREPLRLDLPVDRALREGVEGLMQVWRVWFPESYEPVPIEADLLPQAEPSPSGRTGAFFSGGLDSFFTLIRHLPGGDAPRQFHIDDLITVWGLDVPTRAVEAFGRVRRQVRGVADQVGMELVEVATNLRESGWRDANWGRISQGCGLAAIALLLEDRFCRVLIPSSMPIRLLRPWGTHPFTDPLLSTCRLDLRDDGGPYDRSAKSAVVAQSELAMQNLRVCWADRSDRNCGRCEKCLRTLADMDILGALDRCVTFPPGCYRMEALAQLRLRNPHDRGTMARLAVHAKRRGRPEIARAIARSLRRYELHRLLGGMARALRLRPPDPR
jgi:hypothetical protein